MKTERVVLVDSNIWHAAKVRVGEEEYHEMHIKARDLLNNLLLDPGTTIGLSTYQIGEILELLRRHRVPKETRNRLFADFLTKKFIVVDLKLAHVKTCVELSTRSNIHVYDYFVAVPLEGVVNKIYSADDHFQHSDFRAIAEVENPLHPWVLREGRRPARMST